MNNQGENIWKWEHVLIIDMPVAVVVVVCILFIFFLSCACSLSIVVDVDSTAIIEWQWPPWGIVLEECLSSSNTSIARCRSEWKGRISIQRNLSAVQINCKVSRSDICPTARISVHPSRTGQNKRVLLEKPSFMCHSASEDSERERDGLLCMKLTKYEPCVYDCKAFHLIEQRLKTNIDNWATTCSHSGRRIRIHSSTLVNKHTTWPCERNISRLSLVSIFYERIRIHPICN